jgi:hypothetical protein
MNTKFLLDNVESRRKLYRNNRKDLKVRRGEWPAAGPN